MSDTTPHHHKSRRQQLLHPDNLQTLQLSVQALGRAATHPYVLEKLKTCAKPVLAVAAGVYFVGMVLLLPLTLVAFLVHLISLGRVPHRATTQLGRRWLHDTVSLVPLLALVLMRNLIRKPLFKAFIHMLREVNPAAAAAVERGDGGRREKAPRRRTSQMLQRVALLMAFELALAAARRTPYLGRPAVLLTNFLTMKAALGRDRAIALSALGVLPWTERWVLQFVQLWRSSVVLGQELVADYTAATVPPAQRTAFLKAHDVDIPLFALPGTLLLRVPLVGPLAFIPVQASAAWLADELAREGRPPAKQPPAQGAQLAAGAAAPTLPAGPAPNH